MSGRLSRIDISTGAETVLINDWCQQFPSHSIGALGFRSRGMLYVSGGDGASFNQVDFGQLGGNLCTDPPNEGGAIRSQDLRTTPPTETRRRSTARSSGSIRTRAPPPPATR